MKDYIGLSEARLHDPELFGELKAALKVKVDRLARIVDNKEGTALRAMSTAQPLTDDEVKLYREKLIAQPDQRLQMTAWNINKGVSVAAFTCALAIESL